MPQGRFFIVSLHHVAAQRQSVYLAASFRAINGHEVDLLPSLSIIQDNPTHGRGVEEDENYPRRPYCLPPGIAKCYPQSVNRNIFYIIGVIVVIIVVLKVLGLF